MLILVGVTINFALNGGIITKAKQASLAMQKAADLEELQLAVISAMDYTTGEIVRADLVASLSSGWNVTSTAPYTCTSPSGNVFIVTADGAITESGSNGGGNTGTDSSSSPSSPEPVSSEDFDYIKTYFLGAEDEITGERPKNIALIGQNGILDVGTYIFTDTDVKMGAIDAETGGNTIDVYVRYNEKAYKATVSNSTYCASDVIQVGTSLPEKVGKYVQFSGSNDLWVVLYDEGEQTTGAQLISANTFEVEDVYLGYGDEEIDWTNSDVISEANIFEDTESRTECIIGC